jgi:hypothetical protein
MAQSARAHTVAWSWRSTSLAKLRTSAIRHTIISRFAAVFVGMEFLGIDLQRVSFGALRSG